MALPDRLHDFTFTLPPKESLPAYRVICVWLAELKYSRFINGVLQECDLLIVDTVNGIEYRGRVSNSHRYFSSTPEFDVAIKQGIASMTCKHTNKRTIKGLYSTKEICTKCRQFIGG